MKPPNETGGTRNAARLKSNTAVSLSKWLRGVKSCAPTIWLVEGWRLLNEFQATGEARHLTACKRHVAGMRGRLRHRIDNGRSA